MCKYVVIFAFHSGETVGRSVEPRSTDAQKRVSGVVIADFVGVV
jgi:hypothetical protein